MPIDLDPYCKIDGCGRTKCDHCPFCHQRGHKVEECPKAPSCEFCGSKGHSSKNCLARRMTPVKNHRAHRGVPELSRLQSKTGTLNITVTPSAHNSQAWLDIPQEIREDVTLQPLLLFPDLTSLCHQVIMEIRTKRLLGTTGSSAFTLERYPGDTGFAKHLVSFVRPEIKSLEGKLVTRKHLDEIMTQQKSEDDGVVETSIGYLDYVVDSRDALYVRWYVGQSRSPRRRIISQHSQSILRGENSSLHYFIIWLGNGYRSANFIKLWSFPNAIGDSDTNKDVSMRNILEAVFCRAFSTHHGSLTTWDKADGLQSGYGLNIMTPLVQSNAVTDIAIAVSKSQIHASKDPQIQY